MKNRNLTKKVIASEIGIYKNYENSLPANKILLHKKNE